MKKLFLFGALLSLGVVSCRSQQCPAYTSTKPAPQQATVVAVPITASVAPATNQQ